MRRIAFVLLVMFVGVFSTACANQNRNVGQSSSQAENELTQKEKDLARLKASKEKLFESFVDASKLSTVDITTKRQYVFDDRTFIMEDQIENELDKMIFDYFYYLSAAKFDEIATLTGSDFAHTELSRGKEDMFQEGWYMLEYVVHNLNTMTTNQFQRLNKHGVNAIQSTIDEYQLNEFAVVDVDVSWKHNEAALKKGPQDKDGRYHRYFIFGKTKDNPDFKLYDIHWYPFI